MADEKKSLDVLGAGKIAESIPTRTWDKLTDAALDLLRPFTAVFGGTGRWLEQKFERMTDDEKANVVAAIAEAQPRLESADPKQRKRPPSGRVLSDVVASVAVETDPALRSLWTNLLCNELVEGGVHPEFASILSRMSTADAVRLAELGGKHWSERVDMERLRNALNAFLAVSATSALKVRLAARRQYSSSAEEFVDEHLESLGLVRRSSGPVELTAKALVFLDAVSDQTLDVRVDSTDDES